MTTARIPHAIDKAVSNGSTFLPILICREGGDAYSVKQLVDNNSNENRITRH
jgi:hypothetical protein